MGDASQFQNQLRPIIKRLPLTDHARKAVNFQKMMNTTRIPFVVLNHGRNHLAAYIHKCTPLQIDDTKLIEGITEYRYGKLTSEETPVVLGVSSPTFFRKLKKKTGS